MHSKHARHQNLIGISAVVLAVGLFSSFMLTGPVSAHNALPQVRTTNPYTGTPNCTWYAWQRLHDVKGIDLQFSADAKDWIGNLSQPNDAWSEKSGAYVTVQLSNNHPQAGDIVIFPVNDDEYATSSSGHVAYVESVNESNGTFFVSQQSKGDTRPGLNTSPYPWVAHYSFSLTDVQSPRHENGQARFAHFSSTSAQPTGIDNARSIGQSTNLNVQPNQRLNIYFVKQNSGTTTWSDAGGYQLLCVSQCMGTSAAGFNGAKIAPGQSFQFNIALTAPNAAGAYASAWAMAHAGKQFGDATMFVLVTVVNACTAARSAPDRLTEAAVISSLSDTLHRTEVSPQNTADCGSQGGGCINQSPTLRSPGNGATLPNTEYVRLSWATACSQSLVELSGGPYGTLNFGGWHAQSQLDIGQMWPGTYTWHVKGRDQSGRESNWSGTWRFTIGSGSTSTQPSNSGGGCSGSGGVTLYADANFSGACRSFGPGEYSDLSQFGMDLNVTSIRDANAAYHITLYDQKGLTGTPAYADQDTPQLTGYWNDRARSMRIEVHGPPSVPTPTPTPTRVPTPTPVPTPARTPTPSTTIPETPYLVYPSNGASFTAGQAVMLYWNYHAYEDEVYTELITPSGSVINFGGWSRRLGLTTDSLTETGQYQWHVKARNLLSGKESAWSAISTFVIVAPAAEYIPPHTTVTLVQREPPCALTAALCLGDSPRRNVEATI